MSDADPAPSGTFADLRSRILAAAGLAVVAVFCLWWGGALLLLFAAAAACIMLLEYNAMCQAHGDICSKAGYAVVVGGVTAVLSAYVGWWLVMLVLMITLGAVWVLNERRVDWRAALGMTIIVIASAGIYMLRGSEGFWLVLWLALCVAAADTGGYFFGRIFGGPKLWPRVSPKKTWSGFLGGVLLSVIVALAFAIAREGSIGAYVLLGILIAVVALIGDLMESAAKRYYGVKDSGTIMPGHGGLMDRFDGLALVLILFVLLSATGPSARFLETYSGP